MPDFCLIFYATEWFPYDLDIAIDRRLMKGVE
jgi:hypothetical protein